MKSIIHIQRTAAVLITLLAGWVLGSPLSAETVVEETELIAPVLSQQSFDFYKSFDLTITDLNTPAATIKYTLDGSTPSATNGFVYTAPINIAVGADATVKAVAVSGDKVSAVVEATYHYVAKQMLRLTVNPRGAINPAWCSYSSSSEYGNFGSSEPAYITEGQRVDISFSTNTGYVVKSIAVNSTPVEFADRSFSFTMPSTAVEIVINAAFDPSSPGDPQQPTVEADTTTYYTLTVVSNPSGAYSFGEPRKLTGGQTTTLYAYSNAGYVFTGWVKDGQTLGTQKQIDFTMPYSDAVIMANYVYNPLSPGDPEKPIEKHPLTVAASPQKSATFSTSGSQFAAGEEYSVYAYPCAGYKLKGWIVNGVPVETTAPEYRGVMTEAGAQVVALLYFDPASPANPGANDYDPTTGQVIIDDFAEGFLYSALSTVVKSDDYANVSSLIVKGRMNATDYGVIRNLSNAATIDLSRTGGESTLPFRTFQSMNASSILLSSDIAKIGNYAFQDCNNLAYLTIYAQEPPVCTEYSFADFTNKDNCTVYVPVSAIELYSNAEYWKDFTILPISDDTHLLQVNLPQDAADGRYKHNSLEVVNVKSGVRQKYVISDRMLYTFSGLQKDEQYNVYMYSQAGLEIGRIENVVIPDDDIEVTFDNLKSLHTVFAKVLAADATDVTSQVTVEWLQPLFDGSSTYLRKAASLGEVPDGQQLICRVTLNNSLGVVYTNPDDIEFVVNADNNTCIVNLAAIRPIELSGTVVNGDGAALSDASVSVTQTLNGKYSKTFTTKTNRNGSWSLSALDAPVTVITFAASECVNVNDTIGAFAADVSALDLGKTTLKSIVGARISYAFTYHAAGSDEVQDYYLDYQNVAFSVFNVTQNRAHNEVSIQYPILVVLDENINVGDELQLTASSKTGAFNPIVNRVTIDADQRAEATFDIVGKGGISASFEMTENPAVAAMLYGPNGELLRKTTYSEAKALFTDLDDGAYTLITMGQSDLMNSILRLSSFDEIGLVEGEDYVKNIATVESGQLTAVVIPEVPAFDESLFYYTNSNTSFSVNKSSITTGNYLTLRAAIDFKGAYADNIGNVALVVDLPEACDFVEQSVIQGKDLLPYTIDNNRLVVQLGNNYRTQTRFCVVPTAGGSFNATASIVFDYNGKSITQPIGSATSEIKDIEITVPSVIAKTVFPVKGFGKSNSLVTVYVNDELAGTTNVLANGTWSIECPLLNPQNLKQYTVYATIASTDGTTLQTASKTTVYDMNVIQAKTVTMTFFNGWIHKNVSVVFDYESKTTSSSSYMFYTTTNLTFIADLSENSPEVVSSVDLYVYTDKNEKRCINLSYDASSDRWVGMSEFSSNNLPINLSISINGATPILHDRTLMTNVSRSWQDSRVEAREILDTIEKEELYESEQAIIIDEESRKFKEVLAELLAGFESGIEDTIIDDYYSQLGIDTSEMHPVIPDNADMDWLNGILEKGDSILSQTIQSEISDEEYAQLISLCDSVLADDKGFDEKEAFASVLQDKIDITADNGDRVIFYQTKLSELSDQLTAGCDTTVLSMTEGPAVMVLSNEEAGITIITDEYNDIATIIISRTITSEVRANIAKAKKQNDFVAAMKQGATDVSNFANSIIEFVNGAINDANEEVKELQSTIDDLESRLNRITSQIADNSRRLEDVEKQLRDLKNQKVVSLDEYKKLRDQIAELYLKREDLLKSVGKLNEMDKGLRKQLNKLMPEFIGAMAMLGELNDFLGILKGIYNIVIYTNTAIEDYNRWHSLINAIEPCEGDESNASILKRKCESDWTDIAWFKGYYPSIGITGIASIVNGVLFVKRDIKWLIGFVGAVITGFIENTANAMFDNATNASTQWYPKRYKEYKALKCENQPTQPPVPPQNDWPRNRDGGNNDSDDGDSGSKGDNGDFDPIIPIHDPSGFVYEAVPENRVEGVQASAYYKETKEDMYGDLYEEVVLWNAEEYAQQNPLFTDENGMYRWDVPQGLWQVKFEKDGYLTAYSEWLPVPPPQLEVNIGIVQNKQPEVTEARAYEDGVEVQFDKFMDLSTLTAGNIFVTANGEKLVGEIRLIDSALADEYADEDDENATRYASRVRFVPQEKLSTTTGEVRITVSRNVRSYAGIPMAETFSQVLDIEKEVQMIVADDVKVLYGGEKQVTIYAMPYDAAVGRTLHIANSSDLIASTDISEATIDEEGKVVVTVKGDLPGRSQLSFSIDDVTATGQCTVDVVTEIITAEAPKSSRASGTAVYRGTKIELSTESKNATIYFTTDGSCPCDENGTRRKYTVPIIINEDTKILAMTSVGSGDVSETVEFNYTLKRSDMDFRMEQGWTWISHNFENAIAPADISADAGVRRILSRTQEAVRDPQLGMVGSLSELSASASYKVEAVAATARLRLSDVAWNPANPIAITPGWNWVGYPVSQTMTVNEAFAASSPESLDVVVGQNGFAQFDGEKWIGTLETMSPGLGYLYHSQSAKNIVYNTGIVSNASAKYATGIAENSPLVLDIHKYAVVMPVVATLCDAAGTPLDNQDYKVAAFCGSECRGIGRVVSGLVMMNVYGNISDNITFLVTDATGQWSFSNDASLTFSETVVGNIFAPLAIAIDNLDGVADVNHDGNIKVLVDGDVLRISGIAAEDINLVEVYDTNGLKLIRETVVPTSGIKISTLAAGVYVVIVDGNGEYSYHKIAIR